MSDLNTEIIDGYVVDIETGEVLGLAGRGNFHVTDRTSAEWVLERMAQDTSALKALDIRRDQILHNIETQRQEIEHRAAWLQDRFGAELKEWATQQLLGHKRKSLQLDHGKVGFRQTHGSVKVFDVPTAVAWLNEHCKRAVTLEPKILVSAIPDELRPELPPNAFDYTPPENKFYVA